MKSSGINSIQAPAKKKISFKTNNLQKPRRRWKKWLLIILGVLLSLFLVIYLYLGELRFFANHIFRLGFFHKNYLVLLQNNYELRPTGGFITGYGEVSLTMGLPTNFEFYNSYNIDTDKYLTPPYPQEELLKNEWYPGYTFKDANWNPDFPTSVVSLLDFYHKKFPDKDVDGIIVINFSFIENLVEKLGGIELNGEVLTADNLFKKITDSVNDVDRHNEDALFERKSILSELAGPLMSKAVFHPFKTKAAFVEGLHNKDVFIWLDHQGLEDKLKERKWANAMEMPKNSDLLAVNLANLGSKKTDRYLLKEVHHQINLQNELPEITTTVKLKLPGQKNIYSDDYKGFLRFYLPMEAQITSEEKDLHIETEGDFRSVGSIINLKAGEEMTFALSYQLPTTLLNKENYKLRLIKQSGDQTYYTLAVEAKDDYSIASNTFWPRENKAFWQGIPQNDLDFSLKITGDTSPPYPIEQIFNDLKTITVYWNEAISPSSGGEIANYEIVDLNKANPEVKDTVVVKKVEIIDGKASKLTLEGVTKQELESYQVRLKGIKDLSNNAVKPDPKVVTAIQRLE